MTAASQLQILLVASALTCGGSAPTLPAAAPAGTSAQAESSEHTKPTRAPLPSPEEIAALPADGGPEFNRLVFEESPYLLQHARNPVDWFPWGPEAFERAQAEDKPIFLSLGYSTCHWCHVMEHESFEDDEVAALLNRWFICIKVDREERPDVDHVYMSVTQAMTGRGGWPNTIAMTADKKPFFAATYIPKGSRSGRTGLMDLLPRIADAWKDNRPALLADADNISTQIAAQQTGAPGNLPGRSTLDLAQRQLASRYEPQFGGFGSAPKFPVPHNLLFLLHMHRRTGDPGALAMVEHTLRSMRAGGIWDHVGFGFHRYSTDTRWLLPHFEKMLYDQALISMALIATWQVTGKSEFQEIAEDIFTYVLRDMTSKEGGFYSAEDADSEGEEGLFYLWTPEELTQLLGEEEGKLFATVYNIVPGGNFADQSTGQKTGDSIAHLPRPLAEHARALGTPEAELAARMEAARALLFDVREKRIHPLKDDKVLTDWNGLMIAALARGGSAFHDDRYLDAAKRAAAFCLRELRDDDGRLYKRWRAGEAGLQGTLEDYAFLSFGLLELYEASYEVRWLQAAIEITDAMVANFQDGENGGFFLGAADGEKLFVRAKEFYDGAIPSGNSVAALVLAKLGRLTTQKPYDELAFGTVKAHGAQLELSPTAYTQMLLAVDFIVGPSFEIVLAGEAGTPDFRAMAQAVHRPFVPNKVIVHRPPGENAAIVALAPYTEFQTAKDGKATAFVCQNYTCQAPTTDPEVVVEALRPAAPEADK